MLARVVGIGDSRVDEVLRVVELDRAGEPARQGLLARDAPAARPRGRAPRRTRSCSSSTSRPTGSTRRACAGCATSCARSPAEGHTVLVSSHVLAEVAQTVDHVLIINDGRLVREARLDELTTTVGGSVRVRSPQSARLAGGAGGGGDRRERARRRADRPRHDRPSASASSPPEPASSCTSSSPRSRRSRRSSSS